MRWDQWWWQPWAWLWSDLERDRLGPWLAPIMCGTWIIPAGLLGGWWGVISAALLAAMIPLGVHGWAKRLARYRGWQTFLVVPTSWAVRRRTEQVIFGAATHWAAIPHYERHALEVRWSSPDAYTTQRKHEWHLLYNRIAMPPTLVLISHGFSTIAHPPAGLAIKGTPFPHLPVREAKAIGHTQRKMFGRTVAHPAPLVDPHVWNVIAVPLDQRALVQGPNK